MTAKLSVFFLKFIWEHLGTFFKRTLKSPRDVYISVDVTMETEFVSHLHFFFQQKRFLFLLLPNELLYYT